MQKAAKRNLVLTTVSSFNMLGGTYQTVEQEELYQHIVSTLTQGSHKTQSLEVGNRLIAVAEHALAMCQTNTLEQAGRMLISAPLPRKYDSIGQYYKALAITRRGDPVSSTAILEDLAASPATPHRYRARALKAIGGNHLDLGNLDESLRFFLEACHAASPKYGGDLLTATLSPWMVAVIRSIDGDHKGALEDLEKLSPFVQLIAPVYPHYYYFYANALAVEWGELGRVEEAQHACHIALASPYASVNPEWHETAKDIKQKARRASHSVITISRRAFEPGNSLEDSPDPVEDLRSSSAQDESQPENLVIFPSSPDRPARVSADPFDRKLALSDLRWMTTAQKRSLVMEIAQANGVNDEVLERMMKAAGVFGGEEAGPLGDDITAESFTPLLEEACTVENEQEEKYSGAQKGINLEEKSHLDIIISLLEAILGRMASPRHSQSAPTI